jgi:hypothetical protein
MTDSEPPMTLHTMRERLAAQSRWASIHRSIVLRRQADASYAHVVARNADGSRVLSWDPKGDLGKELTEAFKHAELDFEERFGRKPRPDDLVFTSPSAAEPEQMSVDEWNSELDGIIENALEAGLRTEPLLAWRKLGYIVTEMNMHLFSPQEVRDFLDVVRQLEAENYSNPG